MTPIFLTCSDSWKIQVRQFLMLFSTKSYLTLWPHGLQHTRFPCPSLSPRVCSNSCLLSQWWFPNISFSAAPLFFCLQSFPASGSFPVCWLFPKGGQSIWTSASATVLPLNSQGWFSLGLTSLIPYYPRNSKKAFTVPQFKNISFSMLSLLYDPTLTSIHEILLKPQLWLRGPMLENWCLCILICCIGLS